MAAPVGALRVTIGANTAQFEQGMKRAASSVRKSGQDIRRSLTETQSAATRAFRNIAAAAGVTIGAAGILAGARAFLRYADAAKQLEAQLRLATRESGSFAQAQEDVRRIATETRSGIEETAQLYATFQRNARELGITQEQAARATQTVSEAFLISGASAAEAAGGLRQFLQGVQSGTLRGEELNSVLENAPRLARLLADSLGVTIGQLRAMGQEGKLTADKLINALTNRRFTEGIDAEFRALPVTFEQSMTLVRNAAIVTFGAFDRGGEFSQALANFARQGSDTFTGIADDAHTAGATIRSIFDGLANAFDPMAEGAANVFSYITSLANDAAADIRALMRAWADITHNYPTFGVGATAAMRHGIMPRVPGFVEGSEDFDRAQTQSVDARTQNAGLLGSRSIEALVRAGGPSAGAVARPPRTGTGGGRGGGGANRAEQERKAALRDEHQFQSEMRRFRVETIRAQQDQLTDEIARSQLDDQILILEREQYVAEQSLAVAVGDRSQVEADALIAARTALDVERQGALELDRRRETEAEAREIEEHRFELAATALRQESQLAETAAERRDVELRLLELSYAHERAKLAELAAAEGLSETARARAQASLDDLDRSHEADRQGVVAGTRGPMESWLASIPQTAAEVNEALEGIAAGGLQSIADGLTEAILMTKSWGEVFKNIGKQIIADLVRIGIQRALVAAIGAVGGSGGLGGIFGGGKASGGPVIPGRTYVVGEKGPELLSMGGNRGYVTPNGGGRAINFDLRGAVMTQDLLMQMGAIGQVATETGAASGSALAQSSIHRRTRARIP